MRFGRKKKSKKTKLIKDKKKNGVRAGSLPGQPRTPPPERKHSKLAALGRIFKPWKWKRKRKSEKIEKTAIDLERKISVRSTREELIRKGVLKPDETIDTIASLEKVKEDREDKTSDGKYDVNYHSDGAGDHTQIHIELSNTVSQINPDHTSIGANGLTTANSPPPDPGTGNITTHAEIEQHKENAVSTSHSHITPIITTDIPPNLANLDSPPAIIVQSSAQAVFTPSYNTVPQGQTNSTPSGGMQQPIADDPGPVYMNTSEIQNSVQYPDYDNLPNEPDDPPPPVTPASQTVPVSHLGTPVVDTTTIIEIPAKEPDLSRQPVRSALKGKEPKSVGFKPTPKPRTVRMSPSVHENKENQPVPGQQGSATYDGTADYDNLHNSDSSDDDNIHYRDDDEDPNSLAAKVSRKDSLARFLSNRPQRNELIEKHIIPTQSDDEVKEHRKEIGTKLTRRLSLRPTAEELEQRNILHKKSGDEEKNELEEKKRTLIRKLSFRPTIEELKERKIIKFSDYVEVTDANEYDRRADKPWTRLTPRDKAMIRRELNEFKSTEMEVHEESKHLTRFHRP